MARIKRGIQTHKRHKKILSLTKGYKLGRNNLFRQAKQAWLRAGTYAYRDRRNKKRDFRSLWIVQLNAATRAHGMSYSQFIYALDKMDSKLNRKVLAELAIKSPEQFSQIIEKAKETLVSVK